MSTGSIGRIAGGLGALAALAVLVAFGVSAQAAHPPEGGGGAQKWVNMERLLRAAQLDDYRKANHTTPGAVKSVKRVQRALRAKGYRVAVDGNFGSQTMRAYHRWQKRSVGATGIGANGLPGEASLKKLGRNRFRVRRVVSPGRHVTLKGGSVLNRRTNRMKMAAADRLHRNCRMVVTQGSYNSSVEDSAATHSGGGALDISVKRGCGTRHRSVVRSLRRVGFAAWYRTTDQGFTSNHIHAIAISDPDLSTPISHPGEFTAMHQVVGYARRQDGRSSPPFNQPMKRKLYTWEQYKRAHR